MWYEDPLELALEDEGIDPSDLPEDDEDSSWDLDLGSQEWLDSLRY